MCLLVPIEMDVQFDFEDLRVSPRACVLMALLMIWVLAAMLLVVMVFFPVAVLFLRIIFMFMFVLHTHDGCSSIESLFPEMSGRYCYVGNADII